MPSSLGFLLHLGLTDEAWGGRSIFSKEGTCQALGQDKEIIKGTSGAITVSGMRCLGDALLVKSMWRLEELVALDENGSPGAS